MKIKLTQVNARLIESLFNEGFEVYINDNFIDYLYENGDHLTVEIDGYDRSIDFGEEIDVRIVRVIRTEVEVDFET